MSVSLGDGPEPSFSTLYCKPLAVVLTPSFFLFSARNFSPSAAFLVAASLLAAILVVVAVLGFLFAVQVRSEATAQQYLSSQDNVTLGLLITGLSQANNRLVLARVELSNQAGLLKSVGFKSSTDVKNSLPQIEQFVNVSRQLKDFDQRRGSVERELATKNVDSLGLDKTFTKFNYGDFEQQKKLGDYLEGITSLTTKQREKAKAG